MANIQEIWKPIEGYEFRFSISSLGRVKSRPRVNKKTGLSSKKNEFYYQRLGKNGYYSVGLWKNNKEKRFSVHRLVALHFIPNPNNKPQVNHIDGNKLNNNASNLEWTTPSENAKHRFSHLGHNVAWKGKRGKDVFSSKPVRKLSINGEIIEDFENATLAAESLNLKHGPTWICACCNGKAKTAYGFKWQYIK